MPRIQARAQLAAAREQSLRGLAFDGRWVLQLASKTDGIIDPGQTAANGSHTFRYADIQVQFDQLSAVARSAGWTPLVVTADDFGTKRTEHGEQMWVLLADGRWASKAQAQVSCAALFPQVAAAELPNWCVPRTLVAPPR